MIHDPPTLCQPYFDSSREPGDRYRFQRMCGACWNAGAQLWYSAAEAAEAAATAAAAASAAAIIAELDAIPDAVLEVAVRQAEGGEAAAASDDDALPPDDSYLAAASGDEAEDAEPLPPPPPLPPPSDQPQPAPLVVPPPPLPLTDEQRSAAPVASPSHLSTASPQPEPEYMSTDDERGLAKRIWTDCSDLVPRPRYDGTLSSAAGAALGGPDAAAALTKLRKEMPALPHIKPAPAEQRARALYVHAGAGSWTPELKKQARSCFEAEAAAVECVLCIPEVVCREELMETPQFQVKEGDAVVGCKEGPHPLRVWQQSGPQSGGVRLALPSSTMSRSWPSTPTRPPHRLMGWRMPRRRAIRSRRFARGAPPPPARPRASRRAAVSCSLRPTRTASMRARWWR
mmetsp:Transcript_11863/g.39308  ORF Transcript_11863/g.39308 Transcript_11863/m.39308 type:complete len:400 (+) Transcript_11863:259-1458(+)